jgi:tRNA 5-methylaminomethyl-2-thiouridine biosynthesis bifunctional protein
MITAVLNNKKHAQSRAPWYELAPVHYQKKQAVIIGAGLAGLTAAWSLVQRGWQVTVIEKHPHVAAEASGNPAGLLMPRLSIDNKADARFYAGAMLYASHCLDQLQQQAAEKFWFHDGVYSIFKAGKAEKLIDRHGYAEQFMKILHQHELKIYMADPQATLSFFPAAGWASPKGLCEQLLRACGESLQLIQQNVVDVQQQQNQWQALDAHGQSIASAEVMIIASGVGANLFEGVSWLPLSSVRGQITEIPVSQKSISFNTALSFDAYVTPEHNGVHYAGASYRAGDDSTQLSQVEQDETLSHLQQCLPGVFTAPARLNGRVGFRPVSDDKTPIVGAVPDQHAFAEDYKELHHGRPNEHYPAARYLTGLYISAAHGSRGLCSSFLAAEMLAAMIVNEPLPVSQHTVEHLSPARFLMRKLKRGQSLD